MRWLGGRFNNCFLFGRFRLEVRVQESTNILLSLCLNDNVDRVPTLKIKTPTMPTMARKTLDPTPDLFPLQPYAYIMPILCLMPISLFMYA